MAWTEFCDLLSGLSANTALMRVVSVRAEQDPEVLKDFTPEQRRIRSQWRARTAKRKSPQDVSSFLAQMQTVFQRMSGGGDKA